MSGKNTKKFILGGVCLLVACGAVGTYMYSKHTKKEEPQKSVLSGPPIVRVDTAKIMPICRFLKLTGVLKPNNLVEIKSEVDSTISKILFEEGGSVKKGDLLIQLDDSRAVAALKEAEAQYEKIKSEYIPSNELAAKGVISKVRKDTLKADLDAAEARVEVCKVNVMKHKIIAPFSGKIGLKEVSEGQYVGNGFVLAKLVDNEQLRIDFKVPDVNMSEVYQGQNIDISVDGNDNAYTAVISAIDPESDRNSHSFNVRAIMNERSENVLKPGMFVKVGVALDRCKNGIVIPESAIERYGDMEHVFRILEDGTAVRTNVTSGYRNKGVVEILSGLNENDTVVTEGGARVIEGRPVQILTDELLEKIRKEQKAKMEKEQKAKQKGVAKVKNNKEKS